MAFLHRLCFLQKLHDQDLPSYLLNNLKFHLFTHHSSLIPILWVPFLDPWAFLYEYIFNYLSNLLVIHLILYLVKSYQFTQIHPQYHCSYGRPRLWSTFCLKVLSKGFPTSQKCPNSPMWSSPHLIGKIQSKISALSLVPLASHTLFKFPSYEGTWSPSSLWGFHFRQEWSAV